MNKTSVFISHIQEESSMAALLKESLLGILFNQQGLRAKTGDRHNPSEKGVIKMCPFEFYDVAK